MATSAALGVTLALNMILLCLASTDRSFEANYLASAAPKINAELAVLSLLVTPWICRRSTNRVCVAHMVLSIVVPFVAATEVPVWINHMGRMA
jgi:hypothetical protein